MHQRIMFQLPDTLTMTITMSKISAGRPAPQCYSAVMAALILSASILLFSSGCKQSSANVAAEGIEIGNTAPDLTLTSLDGGTYTLSSFRGKKVMLNFWASWCGPCQIEAPIIKAIYDKYSKENLVVLTVDASFNDNAVSVQKFLNKYGLTAPVLLDLDGKVSETYAANYIPITYFIDAKGIIRGIKHGPFLSQDEIKKVLDQL